MYEANAVQKLAELKNEKWMCYPDHMARVAYITDLMSKLEWNSFLEVGAAFSPIMYVYKQRFKREVSGAYGLELTKAFCKAACEFRTVEPVRGDWMFMPFKPKSFDLTVWSEGPEHAINSEHVFSQIGKVTRKYFITSCPTWQTTNWEHLNTFTPETLNALLSKYFDVLDIKVVEPCWIIALGVPLEG